MENDKFLTLYELQSLIKEKIGASLPLPYWVVAEISELKVNYSGHCYIELVEKGGENSVPRAKVNAVIWRNQYAMISSYFKSETSGELKAGLKVLLKVVINYHELYGLSFQITDIEPSYTLGDLEAQRIATIERLRKEGIIEMNHECDLPIVIQRIAVVSSRNAAGYEDFINELTANPKGYRYKITLFDAFMQGNDAESSIIAALDNIADALDEFDVVVFIRGGGSQSDLQAFNSYALCSHLAQFPLPLITGIGHDKDKSVADLVSKVSLKTPTAVAGFLTAHNELFESTINEFGDKLRDIATRFLNNSRSILETAASNIEYKSRLKIANESSKLNSYGMTVVSKPQLILSLQNQTIKSIDKNLRQQISIFLDKKNGKLQLLESITESKNLSKILKMGFALVRSEGKIVRDLSSITIGDDINIEIAEGFIEAKISKCEQKNR